MSKNTAEPIQGTTPLHESAFGWKSIIIYACGIIYFLDSFFQIFLKHDAWLGIGSLVIAFLIGVESYNRIKKHRTWLGEKFSVLYCSILLAALVIFYVSSALFGI